jgi:hypothetical protein
MQDLFRGYAVFLRLLQLIFGLTSFTRSVTNLFARSRLYSPTTQDSQYEMLRSLMNKMSSERRITHESARVPWTR